MDPDRRPPAPFTTNPSHLLNLDSPHEVFKKHCLNPNDKTMNFPRALTQTSNNTENILLSGNPPKDKPFAFPSRHLASRQGIANPTKLAAQNEGRARKIFRLPGDKPSQLPKSSVFRFPTPSASNILRSKHEYSPSVKEELSSDGGNNFSPVQPPDSLSPQPLVFQGAYSQPFHESTGDVRPPATPDRLTLSPPLTPFLRSGSATTIISEDGRFSEIAVKAITESQKVADDLVQQKSYTNSLLAAQKTANKRLADAQRDSALAKEELSTTQLNLLATQADLASAQALLSQAKEDALVAKAEISRMEEELSQRKNDADMARIAAEEEKAEKVELKKKLSHVRHRLMQLSEDYVVFREVQLDLKTSYETVKLTLEHTLQELLELRRTSRDDMASMQPFLTEGGHLAQISQLKAVISEVQDSLNEAHRVTDLLRDKLHHTTAQLAESMAKVKELECERERGWSERVVVGRNLDRFETKFEELTGRIIKREEESVEALAEAALAEAKVATAVEKLKETQITLEKKEEELVELRDVLNENVKLRLQIDSAERKTSELAAKNHEISGKLLETEHNLRCQEKETIALQSELKLLRANAEELRLSFNESEAIAQKTKEELSSVVFKENVATKKNDVMEAELLRMRGEINHLNESLRQSNSQLVIIQDRFDSQAATLRLAREESGDLQERLLQRESSFISKLGALETDLAVFREQKLTLKTQLSELREESKSQRVAFADASASFKKHLAEQETTKNRLLEMQEQRAIDAEKNATDAKNRLAEMQSRIEAAGVTKLELEGCVEAQSARLENEIATVSGLTEEMITLKKKVVELEQSNAEFVQRTKNLKSRYEFGDLNEDEGEFVASLIKRTQSIHEQDMVAKCNELRRGENMIESLQVRIRTLESTLARCLREKEQGDLESKPMVDLGSWISSSPQATAPFDNASAADTKARASPVGPTPAVSLPITTPGEQFEVATEAPFRTRLGLNISPLTVAPKFTTLSGMDTDDDAPLSDPPMSPPVALGKRERVVSPTKNEDSRRPGRRSKGPITRANNPPGDDSAHNPRPNQKKPAESSTKPRAKKRK